jgi:Ras-related GTP-binding protein C/D
MESRILPRRQSAADAGRDIVRETDEEAERTRGSASSSLLKPSAQLTMDRFLQDLPNAEQPPVDFPPQYHTGRVPNSKAGDGKPRLLLMGQRRLVSMMLWGRLAWLTLRSRSGKSSISSVVFHKLPPSETLYLETTYRIKKESMQ